VDERLAIAGSGTIACGLAAHAARHGDVLVWARSEASAQRARAAVSRACAAIGEDADPSRVVVETDVQALAGATLAVEAVVEEHDAKVAVLRDVCAVVGHDTLLATTTSSLSIEALAAELDAADRFVGLHVFNPVTKMELVELVFPRAASPSTRERARRLCETLDKTPVEVPDIAGFVVNRLLFPYLFSAVELMERTGLAPADIDACMTLGAGHPMGPLAVLDFVGLDVAQAIGLALDVPVPARIQALVAEGALGKKTGRGLYDHTR